MYYLISDLIIISSISLGSNPYFEARMTDRNQPRLTQSRKVPNGFVREDERVLKWQP